MIKDFINGLIYVKDLKPYTVTILAICLMLYVFRKDVSHLIETEILKQDRVVNQLDGNLLVNKSLQEVLEETDSDRAYIFRFHNGDSYYNGTHKNKFSCDYEVVRAGVMKQAENLQNVPVTLYPEFISKVVDNAMYYSDINQIDDIVLKTTLKAQGIHAIGVAPYFRNNNLFAMIGVDYISPTSHLDQVKFDNHKAEIISDFTKRVKRIGDLLE